MGNYPSAPDPAVLSVFSSPSLAGSAASQDSRQASRHLFELSRPMPYHIIPVGQSAPIHKEV